MWGSLRLAPIIASVLVFICKVHSKAEDQRTLLRDSFQTALMNDSKQLLTLQKVFLTPRPKLRDGLYLTVKVIVKGRIYTDGPSFDTSRYCSPYFSKNNSCVYHTSMMFEVLPQEDTLTMENLLTKYDIRMVLVALDPSFFVLTDVLSLDHLYYYSNSVDYMITLDIVVDKIDIVHHDLPSDVQDALYLTLSWAKAYAKSDGNQIHLSTSLEDISWLKEITGDNPSSIYDSDYTFSSSSIAVLIFCTFLWLNTLILIFTAQYVGRVCTWLEEQRKSLKDLYKASAIVLTFINLAALVGDLNTFVLFKRDLGNYFTIKVLFTVLIIIVDISVSCINTLKHNHKRLLGIMHALALCQIIWFVHRLATDTIICVLVFIIAPAQMLGIVTLILSTIVCAILFVSSLLKKGCKCRCSKEILSLLCTLLVAICAVGFIATVTLLFIALVDHGLQSAGIGGFILSLIPPTVVFVIGLCINREIAVNFYRNVLANSTTGSADTSINKADTPVNGTIKSEANETTHLIQRPVAIQKEDDEEEH